MNNNENLAQASEIKIATEIDMVKTATRVYRVLLTLLHFLHLVI